MIYLNPENASSLGEDTFWTWFNREFPSTFHVEQSTPDDWVLQYAVLGPRPGKTVALLWELYAEMKKYGVGNDDFKIQRMKACYEESPYKVVSSKSQLEFYPGSKILPIGVDTDLFKPDKKEHEGRVGFWCGTDHHMKGKDRLHQYARSHPEVKWNIVSKDDRLPQTRIAELMNESDFILLTGRLRPYFMIEWEAMSCDLECVDISGMERDFTPNGRQGVFDQGWSRHQAKEAWKTYLSVA